MKIIVTGSTGLVGRALVRALLADGHQVTRMVRGASQTSDAQATATVRWDVDAGVVADPSALEGHDAVVHLAGESVSEKWTPERKRRILESRVRGTRLIAETIAALERRPKVLVSASAIGFYGDRGEELLTEASASGGDFLSEVCREWEKATLAASQAGVRVVNLRIGIVLSADGGALAKMLTPFKFGVGGRIGSGRQYMSWIDLDDLIGIIKHAIENDSLRGAVNAVAPQPVTNAQFTETLGRVLGRPTLFPVPVFAVKLAFGEMGETLLLGSQRVEPAQLRASGYRFAYANLEDSLRHVLKK
ncbi:MAG TPA: TIGR01777 family oxidoreductase [Pyrinomonadaceae bacterium]|nr:TIGR01777 family oxidoreductase [Pyrinomonadaceae bacterium]